ncbi:hypothetical protein BSAF29S_05012 [Bacillus safensis subsp. safensis]
MVRRRFFPHNCTDRFHGGGEFNNTGQCGNSNSLCGTCSVRKRHPADTLAIEPRKRIGSTTRSKMRHRQGCAEHRPTPRPVKTLFERHFAMASRLVAIRDTLRPCVILPCPVAKAHVELAVSGELAALGLEWAREG